MYSTPVENDLHVTHLEVPDKKISLVENLITPHASPANFKRRRINVRCPMKCYMSCECLDAETVLRKLAKLK